MIKRAIILILILGGLYWLTTSLRNDPNQTPTDKKTETSEDKKVEDKKDSKEVKSEEKNKVGDTKEKNEKKEEVKKKEVKKEVKKETPATIKKEVIPAKSEIKKEEKVKKEKTTSVAIPKVIKKIVPKISYPDRTTVVKVYLYEWAVDISKKEIPSGTVAFEVINNGRFSHDFNIKGVQNFGKVPPHQSSNFTAKFLPGTFEIFSDKRDDYKNGMTENIVIVK